MPDSAHRVDDLDRLRKLQAVTEAALAHLSLDELLDELLGRIREALAADTAAILLLDESTNEVVARAAKGLEEEVEQAVRLPLGRGFAGRVAADRRPVVLDDVDHADVLNPILRQKGVKSLLGVPLMNDERVLGVVHVGTLVHRRFTDEDVELLSVVADRAARAIAHATLFEAERQAAERLRKLQVVTEAALAQLSLDELLDELLLRVRDALATDTAAVLLLDESTNELAARAAKGLEEEVEQRVRLPLGRGFAGRVAAERRPIILDDVDHADVLNPILREKGIKSMLGVPLLNDGQVLGVMHVGTLVHRKFTEDDVELLTIVADRAARGIAGALVHEAVVRLEALERQFIALASHELRTPATAIYGISTTLQHRSDWLSADQRAELLETLHTQAERMRTLVGQLLDLSRLQAGAQTLNVRRVSVRPHLEDIVHSVAGDAAKFAVDAPPDLEIDVDPDALDRIVSNLVANAVRYGAPPYAVAARARDDHTRIVVEDAGPGVSTAFRPYLFDRFTRADEVTAATGSGLGLAIARSYAQAHGGDILYEEVVPHGARFALILPRAIAA